MGYLQLDFPLPKEIENFNFYPSEKSLGDHHNRHIVDWYAFQNKFYQYKTPSMREKKIPPKPNLGFDFFIQSVPINSFLIIVEI
jgi:hypothetical protein